jgi:cytochrome P450
MSPQNAPYVIDLRDAEYWKNPYPTLRAARAQGRTAVTHTGEHVLLHADDAEALHIDPRIVTPGLDELERIGICDGPFYEWRSRTLNVMNGPEHGRLRSFVGPAFAPRQMERLRVIAQERANTLIDQFIDRGELDVIEDFASDLPLWTICRFIGVDDEDRVEIGTFLAGNEEGFSKRMTPELRRRVETSITKLNDYVRRLIARRQREPRDDVVSAMVSQQSKGEGPSDEDFLALLVNILGGAVGSTRAAISNGILSFTQNPDQAELLRQNPKLSRQAVEECLRYHPPFRTAYRKTTEAMSFAGLSLKPRETVFIPRQGINRDPERFEDPDKFNILRPERRHISFSFGAHFCLGQAVARVNIQESLLAFLSRCHDLELRSQPERVPFVVDEQLTDLTVGFRLN